MALFGPAWQASVSEQVPPDALAVGGRAQRHQLQHRAQLRPGDRRHHRRDRGRGRRVRHQRRCFYLPLLIVLFLWKRGSEPSRLPPERLNRAIVSGVRYIINSPSIRVVLLRTLAIGIVGGSVPALMPLIARDLLHGGAQIYGIMLGAFGMGAVIGALNLVEAAQRTSPARPRSAPVRYRGGRHRRDVAEQAGADRGALLVAGAAWTTGGDAVQHRRAAFRAALGRRPLARRVPGRDCRRHRGGQLGLGLSHRPSASRSRC